MQCIVIHLKIKVITVNLVVNKNVPVDEKTRDSKNDEGQSRPNCHYSKDRKMIWGIEKQLHKTFNSVTNLLGTLRRI